MADDGSRPLCANTAKGAKAWYGKAAKAAFAPLRCGYRAVILHCALRVAGGVRVSCGAPREPAAGACSATRLYSTMPHYTSA